MRLTTGIFVFVLVAVTGLVFYSQVMARVGSGAPPRMAAPADQADEVLIVKSTRELHLLRDGRSIRHYSISLGASPQGHKARQGDQRTPEGRYEIDWRNPNSVAHLSLHISYPNEQDIAAAKSGNVDPGGNIMIHGLLNGWGFLGKLHLAWDWTQGCIAVTDAEMREIWARVPNGTPITIVDVL